MNLDLFHTDDSCIQLSLADADIRYYPQFISATEADHYFNVLQQQVNWGQGVITLYGKQYIEPRLSAWYADQSRTYTYSGLEKKSNSWLPELIELKQKVEQQVAEDFNSVLINLYRHQSDSVGWHADDEPELGNNPVIASVSLGQQRKFQLKHKRDKSLKQAIELEHGSLLVMAGTTQHNWLHQIPKTTKQMTARINLTFRQII